MAEKPSRKKEPRAPRQQRQLRLMDFKEGDAPPRMAVYALDSHLKPFHTAEVGDEGFFDLPDKIIAKAEYVVIGPPPREGDDEVLPDREQLVQYRAGHFQHVLESRAVIEIAGSQWQSWYTITLCVEGTVKHCYPYLPLVEAWVSESSAFRETMAMPKAHIERPIKRREELFEARTETARMETVRPDILPSRMVMPKHWCEKVCTGLIEVYRRNCC